MEKDSEDSSEKLISELIDNHLAFLLLDGRFREKKGQKTSHERSFVVYDDVTHNAKEFFNQLKKSTTIQTII